MDANSKKKIEEIIYTLNNKVDFKNDFGLLTGKAGVALFFMYSAKYFNNSEYYNKGLDNIRDLVTSINKGFTYHTFCDGISGFSWLMTHLVQNHFLKENEINFINDLDEYLYKKMINDIKVGNYDYLHGAIGNGIYFLNRLSNPETEKYLIQLIDELDVINVKDKDSSIKWESTVLDINEQSKKVFNFSLSHGMASIIAFLSKAYSKNVHKEKVKYLLEGVVKYLLKNQLNVKIYNSNFPSWISETENISCSRLAWCYGDLGIAIAIYHAGIALSRQDWINISIEVFLHASNRRDLSKEFVIDAGLCHGTIGIAHIYNRMFRNTGIEKFKETTNFWIEETLKMAKFDDGLAGYKSWHTEKYGGWVNEYGLLEGISGIGLGLLSAISNNNLLWDECLLIS